MHTRKTSPRADTHATTAIIGEQLSELGGWLVMRHAPRDAILAPTVAAAIAAPLTAHGRVLAGAFGAELPAALPYQLIYSPVPRCRETALVIGEALELRGAVVKDRGAQSFLAGHFVLQEHDVIRHLVEMGGSAFLRAWFAGDLGACIKDPESAGQEVLSTLLDLAPAGGAGEHPVIHLAVTHDLIVAALLAGLCGRAALAFGWPPCLASVSLQPGDRLTWAYDGVSGRVDWPKPRLPARQP